MQLAVLSSSAWTWQERAPQGAPRPGLAQVSSPVRAAGKGRRDRPGVPAGAGREAVRAPRALTHHRAVDVALGTSAAHLEDPSAQQVGVGAVGRCVAERGAGAAEEQQEGGEQSARPGTHGCGAAGQRPGVRDPRRVRLKIARRPETGRGAGRGLGLPGGAGGLGTWAQGRERAPPAAPLSAGEPRRAPGRGSLRRSDSSGASGHGVRAPRAYSSGSGARAASARRRGEGGPRAEGREADRRTDGRGERKWGGGDKGQRPRRRAGSWRRLGGEPGEEKPGEGKT